MSIIVPKLKPGLKTFLKRYGIALIILLSLFLYDFIKYNQLENNIEYTQAVIIDDFTHIRRTYHFGYEFFVKGVRYKGSGQYDPKTDKVIVGDSVTIVYDRTDPDNNQTLRMYKKGWFY